MIFNCCEIVFHYLKNKWSLKKELTLDIISGQQVLKKNTNPLFFMLAALFKLKS